jgi:site-specific DNA-methyltransferase (adenine-specific)
MRVEHIGNATLYLGEALEVLSALPPCFRAGGLITDPPFGVGFKYESHDDKPDGYIEWLWPLLEVAEGKCAAGAPVFVWQSGTNLRKFAEWFPRDWRLFVAAKNFVQMRPTAMQWSWDPILCWWVGGAKPWSAGTASRDFMVANTAPVVASPENLEKGHPCPRPLDLLEHIVSQWVAPGDSFMDPFMGSGTAGVAAVRRGRGFLGIEKDPKYFDIACRRIEQAQKQGALFKHEEPKAEQLTL